MSGQILNMKNEVIMKQKRSTGVGKRVITAVAASCLLAGGFAHAQTVAGVVKKKVGTVEMVRAGTTLPVTLGTRVQAGDVIKTSQNSGVGLMLKDETRMSLGANSQVALEKFSFDANTYAGSMLVNVSKGTFAMVSGLMAKNNPTAAQVKTPTATAAIRGSSFAVEVP
jgi:hypothetical protein